MRFRNTLLLAALFVAFAGYLYFIEGPSHEDAQAQKKLLNFKPEDVSDVTLTYADRQIVLKRTGDGWRMQKPIDVAADQSAVDNLVRAAADAELKRTVENPQSLDVYGLDKPETVVTIVMKDGKALPAIRLGKAAPVGFSAYAQLEGSSDVKLVPSIFQSGMKREAKDLRDKTVVDFKEDEVQSIAIAGRDSTVTIERDGAAWKIVAPKAFKADPNEVRTFLSSVRGVRAEDFIEEPTALEDYGLDAPRKKITIALGKDAKGELAKREIWIGAEKAKEGKNVLYVKRADAGTVYEVGSWSWAGLNKDASALRDKTVLPFDLASLGAIEVTRRDGETYRLVSESAAPAKPAASAATPATSATPATTAPSEATWKLEGAKSSNGLAISGLAGDLHGLKGYEIAAENPKDLSAFGLTQPEVTFSLIDTGGKPIGRIVASQLPAGGSEEAKAYAMVEGGDVVYSLRGFLYAHLDKKKQDFVQSEPTATPSPASPADDEDTD